MSYWLLVIIAELREYDNLEQAISCIKSTAPGDVPARRRNVQALAGIASG
jgi:hypothetical protein